MKNESWLLKTEKGHSGYSWDYIPDIFGYRGENF